MTSAFQSILDEKYVDGAKSDSGVDSPSSTEEIPRPLWNPNFN
jgi:hypothetical protein